MAKKKDVKHRNQKKKRSQKYAGPKVPVRPNQFSSFEECMKWQKDSVYMIVRGRKLDPNKEEVKWKTLGSGFLAGPNRLLTAAHVVNDPLKGELAVHKNGDRYYLIRHTDDNKAHWHIWAFVKGKDLFICPNENADLAILHLDEQFYRKGDQVFTDKSAYLPVSKKPMNIGTEIGVLGYPMCELSFRNHDIYEPLLGNVLMRVDKGVVNCRYQRSDTDQYYEFTVAFNPGNSGGPIFDVHTGKVISIVHGCRSIPITAIEILIPEDKQKQFKEYKGKSYIQSVLATYSIGVAVSQQRDFLKEHGITVR